MRYRRANIPGACYFFTVNLAERNKSLLVENIDMLRSAFKQVKKNHAFTISAIVVLPDHMHTIWQLPDNDADYPTRWNLIKRFLRTERISNSRRTKDERGIRQRRYWEHLIKDENDFERHVNYIHFNPVKHDYVQTPADWPYRAFINISARGFYKLTGQALYLMVILEKGVFEFVGVRSSPQPTGLLEWFGGLVVASKVTLNCWQNSLKNMPKIEF